MDEPARQRLQLIMQLADERLKLNPRDADALFAMASAQEALDDARGALKSLDRLVEFDSDYPGVWALKAKLHSRLGQADLAQRSQVQSQERDASGGKTNGSTVPCPICENPGHRCDDMLELRSDVRIHPQLGGRTRRSGSCGDPGAGRGGGPRRWEAWTTPVGTNEAR